MAKQPPIPPDNRSPHEHKHDQQDTGNASVLGEELKNPDKHGQQANTKQNTTHQGYQQDR